MSAQLKPQIEEPAQQDQRLRYCPMCDAMIPISEFGVNRAAKDGLNRYCRPHIRQKVSELRGRIRSYRAAARERKRVALPAAASPALPGTPGALQPSSHATIDVVSAYLAQHGEATQKQIHDATRLSLDQIDIALAELLIARRAIGTRALNERTRIYFPL